MSGSFIDSRENAQGAAVASAIAAIRAARDAPRPAAERGVRYRVDEMLREIGKRGRFSSRLRPFAWGFGGFLIGAIFWHMIGFWGFLSAVVLKGPEAGVSVISRPVVVPAGLPNCTGLALNRTTGRTTSVPCPEPMPAFDEARARRQNLAAVDMH